VTALPRRYACTACGHPHPTKVSRCYGCGAKATVEVVVPGASSPDVVSSAMSPPRLVSVPVAPDLEVESGDPEPVPLSQIPPEAFVRIPTGIEPIDAVLGGGLVEGSILVLGAEPGAGKSTAVLQIAVGSRLRTLYATGEETIAMVGQRAERLGMAVQRVEAITERRCEVVIRCAKAMRAELVVIDSIHKLECDAAPGAPGSPGQLKACTDMLTQYARDNGAVVLMIAHVTRDDAIAGPRTLEHDVDVVLMLDIGKAMIDGERGNERILRCAGVKNRGGASNVVGRFAMTGRGLVPLPPATETEPSQSDDQEVS
jgi:DNA repair protein RadA/Sms